MSEETTTANIIKAMPPTAQDAMKTIPTREARLEYVIRVLWAMYVGQQRDLKAEIERLKIKYDKLLYDKSKPAYMRCERCGRDVETACAECAVEVAKAEIERLEQIIINQQPERIVFHTTPDMSWPEAPIYKQRFGKGGSIVIKGRRYTIYDDELEEHVYLYNREAPEEPTT